MKGFHFPHNLFKMILYEDCIKNLANTGEYLSLEFGKVAGGSVFFFHKKDALDKLIDDINERFRTCCLN